MGMTASERLHCVFGGYLTHDNGVTPEGNAARRAAIDAGTVRA